jgi:hypothetical protein
MLRHRPRISPSFGRRRKKHEKKSVETTRCVKSPGPSWMSSRAHLQSGEATPSPISHIKSPLCPPFPHTPGRSPRPPQKTRWVHLNERCTRPFRVSRAAHKPTSQQAHVPTFKSSPQVKDKDFSRRSRVSQSPLCRPGEPGGRVTCLEADSPQSRTRVLCVPFRGANQLSQT